MTYCNAQKLFSSASRSGNENAAHLRLLLSCLGNPERRCKILPVAGGKGKSSVTRMLSGILFHSAIPCVAVIYPCLCPPKDNVFIGDKPLSIEEFTRYTARLFFAVKQAISAEDGVTFSQDELLFCLAVIVAEETGARWLILEIPNRSFSPLSTVRFSSPLTVITSCGEQVPGEVLSMIHPGLDEVVSARFSHNTTYNAVSGACAKAGCRLTVPAFSGVTLIESSLRRTVFSYRGIEYTMPLYGEFSLSNALCALETAAALKRLDCPITAEGAVLGLERAALPARGEILSVSPTLLIDAADDPLSLSAVTRVLRSKGPALGARITLCLSEPSEEQLYTDALSALSEQGFSVTETVRVPAGKENRTAVLLLKAATDGNLILTLGGLPFAHTMHNEFLKVLKTR